MALLIVAIVVALIGTVLWLVTSATDAARTDPPGLRTCVTFALHRAGDAELDVGAVLVELATALRVAGLDVGEVSATEDVEVRGVAETLILAGDVYELDIVLMLQQPGGHPVTDTPLVRRVLAEVDRLLRGMHGAERIVWHRLEDFVLGNDHKGAVAPFDP